MSLKKFTTLCFSTLVALNVQAAPAFSAPKHAEPLSVTTDIKPDDRQRYKNPAWFEISAKCTATTENPSVNLKLELKSGYAIINKKRYKAPHIIESFNVSNKEKFHIQIGKRASVALTLLQEGNTKKLKADCSVSL